MPYAALSRTAVLHLHPLVVVHPPLFHRAVRHVVDEGHMITVRRLERRELHLLSLERRADSTHVAEVVRLASSVGSFYAHLQTRAAPVRGGEPRSAVHDDPVQVRGLVALLYW